MYENLFATYPIDDDEPQGDIEPKYRVAGMMELFQKCSGRSLGHGLYHVLPWEKLEEHAQTIVAAFPSFGKRIIPFGFDWLGRAFAIDGARRENDEPLILMFDFARNEALEIPWTFQDFHESRLIEFADELLAKPFYTDYLGNGGRPPRAHECCGFEAPLFLGGDDALSNLKIIDIDVYWTITAQLIQRISGSEMV